MDLINWEEDTTQSKMDKLTMASIMTFSATNPTVENIEDEIVFQPALLEPLNQNADS